MVKSKETLSAPESLPTDVTLCHEMIRELAHLLEQKEFFINKLQHQLEQLLRARYGPKADRLDPNQLLLFAREMLSEASATEGAEAEVAEPSESEGTSDREKAGNGHGRRKLAETLPRERIEYDVPEDEKTCAVCGSEKEQIGEEVTQQLEYVPATFKVLEHVQFKYACPKCEGEVVVADKPSSAITKGLAGPGLLAHVITSKYCDHLPLNRLEGIFRRQGVEIKRSTMCDWMRSCADTLRPLYELMEQRVLRSKVIHTDDTTVPVQDPDLTRTRTGRLWVYQGDLTQPYTFYKFTASRKRDGPARVLSDFKGYLQADAFAGYDQLYGPKGCTEVACWAHARRKFVEAEKSAPAKVVWVILLIRKLYAVEAEAKELSAEQCCALRQERSRPLLKEFEGWLKEQHAVVLPKSPLGQAIAYTLANWTALNRYVDDGDLDIDNNAAERALRGVAVGRKNWLFAGSNRGGETAAILYSFITTCKQHGRDPFAYLRDVLALINDHSRPRLAQLLPDHWQPLPQTQPQQTAHLPAA